MGYILGILGREILLLHILCLSRITQVQCRNSCIGKKIGGNIQRAADSVEN
jgi:hypothetical protein